MKKSNLCFVLTLALTSYSVGSHAEVTIDDLRSNTPNLPPNHKKLPQKEKSNFYSNITEMMDVYNDYPPEVGAFKIKSEKPLEVQVSPKIMTGDLQQPEYIVENVEKAAIYAAYRILFQTKTDVVKITSIPLLINAQSGKKEYFDQYSITFKINKQSAKKISNRYCKVSTIDELINNNGFGFSDDFKNNCYLATSKNHKSFFADLTHSDHLSY